MTTAFGNRTASPAPATAPPRSRYGGITCADTRDPMLGLGTYRVRVLEASEGRNPGKQNRESVKVKLYVAQASADAQTTAGSTVTMIAFLSVAGLAELKRFAMHAAGHGPTLAARAQLGATDAKALRDTLLAAEAAFDRLDESCGYQGAIIEATTGRVNGAPSLAGRLVDVIVTRGKDVPNPQTGAATGDYFRVYTWGIVPDAEQTE